LRFALHEVGATGRTAALLARYLPQSAESPTQSPP